MFTFTAKSTTFWLFCKTKLAYFEINKREKPTHFTLKSRFSEIQIASCDLSRKNPFKCSNDVKNLKSFKMPRPEFDVLGFIEDMKACKPPYKCPFGDCGKVYKSFSGIHQHILSHANGSNAGSGARTPNVASGRLSPAENQAFFKSPLKETLFYNEADKTVEFESAEGSLQRLSIYDALEIVSKDEWEASLPPSAFEPEVKPEDPPKTPVSRFIGKKGKKTPKSAHKNKPDLTPAQKPEAENEKKILKLPEAHFVEIDDYDIPDAPPMGDAYYRFIEKPAEEMVSRKSRNLVIHC